MLVRTRMTPEPQTVSPKTTLGDALRLTREHNFRHLPVIENGRLLGVVSDRDLRLGAPPVWADETDYGDLRATFEQKTVGDVMTSDATIISTTEDTPIEDAARLLYTHKIGCLPVMRGDTLVGILTETDVMRAFVELFSTNENERRIEVRMQNRPGELSRVVRAIGVDHKINITGLVMPRLPGTTDSVAIMHVQTTDVDDIVEHLRQLGYLVGSPALDLEPEGAHERKMQRVRHWAGDGF